MKKIVINPKYEFIRDYIEQIPIHFDSRGTILESKRNVIREEVVQGKRLVIKSFRKIYLPNRIRYSYFYPSKAQRAFEYAEILLEKGFNTAAPIAYIEVKKNGLLQQSFFVSEYLDFQPLHMLPVFEPEKTQNFLVALSRFTYRLHQNNICHHDFTVGNILFKEINNTFEFALIDNNRMSFGPISFSKRMKNLVRLGLPVEHLTQIVKEYARLVNADEVVSLERLFYYKRNAMAQRQLKKKLKKNLAYVLRSISVYSLSTALAIA